MGAPAEILEEIFTVIEGGSTIGESAEIIQFPSDNGARTFTAVNRTFQGANGTGLNYWVSAAAQGLSAVSAGALMITVSIPEFIAFAVPCLGIAVGNGIYSLDPDGWTNLAGLLYDAGWTVKNKVTAFMVDKGIITFPPEAIEILKDELLRLGIYDNEGYISDLTPEIIHLEKTFAAPGDSIIVSTTYQGEEELSTYSIAGAKVVTAFINQYASAGHWYMIGASDEPLSGVYEEYTHDGKTVYYGANGGSFFPARDINYTVPQSPLTSLGETQSPNIWADKEYIAWTMVYGESNWEHEDDVQKGAIYPQTGVPFRTTYPDWLPWEFPDLPGWSIPEAMPALYPDLIPTEVEPYQEPAQNPEGDDETADEGVKKLEQPETNPEVPIIPTPPEIDPEPGDEGEDIQNPADDDESNPDPIDPDPPTPITPVIPVTPLPDSVHSNKLFTVYNPTSSQLGQLGGYLWDNDLIDILRKIWQNPLDGIISLIQVYATPVTGGNSNIILGYLDSGVSAPVVSSQFVTIDCGSITIPEQNENCLDYIPYTKLELYLPFIGVTEIDTNEFMAGTINIKYKVDVYTGTCLAEVKCTRSRDLANGTILYTFNGNCSQQIPLTSGDARGVLGALIGAAGLGLSIASGGAAAVTGAGLLRSGARVAGGLASMTSQEMLHVGHSGNLSANAGIMGQKKPYLIINRKRAYNANSYNRYYGFPANKTVNPGNHSGFLRLKAGRLQSAATEGEKAEIYELLTHGVIM